MSSDATPGVGHGGDATGTGATGASQSGSTLEHRIGPRGRLTLRQPAGEISIRGVEGDTVRVRNLDGRPLSEHFRVETGDDFVSLRADDGLGSLIRAFGRGSSPDLEIEVPHGASVDVETASGDVSVSDLSGSKRFRSASGDVTLNRLAGSLQAETVSGELRIDGRAALEIAGRSISGDVQIEGPILRRLELSTTSGDVRLDAELSGDGPFSLRTISGDATVVARSGLRIEADTITGDLESDLPHRRESMPGRKVLVVGKAGPTLAFKSVSGDLEVVEARTAAPTFDAAPAAPAAPPAGTAPAERTAAPGPTTAAQPATASAPDSVMDVLRRLERGEISVDEASARLSELETVTR